MTNCLNGARILVTRPLDQAQNLCNLITDAGGIALRCSTLEIVENQPDPLAVQAAAQSDWLIFTSSNAVNFAIRAFNGKMPVKNGLQIAAIGLATAQALQSAGWPVACVPLREFNSEGLLAEPALQAVEGLSCVIVRGVGGREKLAELLSARGAKVAYLEVYRRVKPETELSELSHFLTNDQLDIVTITSGEALQNLMAMVTEPLSAMLKTLPLIVVSDRIRQIAEQMGFKRIAVCKQTTDAAILESLTTLLNEEYSGRINRKTTRESSAHCGG